MSSITQHEVKTAAVVIADDPICQTFTQSSSTLAYASLLIRQKKYDLATHVLHSLEAKKASRFKDMVFYLQAQIGIETGEFAVVKKRLIQRVQQNSEDTVALSLLEADIYLEWAAWQARQPAPVAPTTTAASLAAARASVVIPVAKAGAIPVSAVTSAPSGSVTVVNPASKSAVADFGSYQVLVDDANTLGLAMGSSEPRLCKTTSRNGALDNLMTLLPEMLPGAIATACQVLESGQVQKICFSFQNMTVTSMHKDGEFLDLVTGNINQSLLTMVRAEKIFRKQVA